MLVTFMIITFITFLLIRALPRDLPMDTVQKEVILARWKAVGYNEPLLKQFYIYVKNIVTSWDFGTSWYISYRTPAAEVLGGRLLPTVMINFYSMIFSVPVGILFGIYAAIRKNKWDDSLISTLDMVFISVPSYVYAFLVQYFLYFKLGILQITMYSLADAGGSYFTSKMFVSMIPAIIALSFGSIASYTRFVRAELTEALTSEYMLLARTKGLTRAQATARHALKNAFVPILPSILSEFVGLLGGSMIIEQIFAVPGVGQLYMKSLSLLDYDVFMMDCIFYTFIGLLAGIVMDLSYGFIDPRIRMGEK